MIADKNVAKEISSLMLDFGAKLDASVVLVQQKCSPEEFERYKKAIAPIMADMLLEVMNPLYAKHSDLKPKELACTPRKEI